MYAIIESGGKQFRVEEGTTLKVESLPQEPGNEIILDKILLIGGASLSVGKPYIEGAKVTAKVVAHGRGEKIKVFKKWRRNDSRKLQGHRQNFTTLKITSING